MICLKADTRDKQSHALNSTKTSTANLYCVLETKAFPSLSQAHSVIVVAQLAIVLACTYSEKHFGKQWNNMGNKEKRKSWAEIDYKVKCWLFMVASETMQWEKR